MDFRKIKEKLKNKRFRDLTILALTSLILIVSFIAIRKTNTTDKKEIKIKGVVIQAEVADSPLEHRQGLMYRNDLGRNEGMLFVFENEGNHSFWMKNVLIPLDLIWINSNNQIVHITNSAPPCSRTPCTTYRSPEPAQYVIEIKGGWSVENDVLIGDIIEL